MIIYEHIRGADGVLVVRYSGTSRTAELHDLIEVNGWTARLMFSYGCLLFEVWGAASVLATTPADESADDFITVEQAAAELGISTFEFIECMIRDGLLIELDGELIASPHPAIQRLSTRRDPDS